MYPNNVHQSGLRLPCEVVNFAYADFFFNKKIPATVLELGCEVNLTTATRSHLLFLLNISELTYRVYRLT